MARYVLLLSFTVRNHKSIRDEVTVDLTRPSLKTLLPKTDWASASYPIAGIFGGNATGKSALLDALRYALTAVGRSATSWQASKTMQRAPFKLDGDSQASSSTYELDLVHEGRRYLYGFEVDREGIKREWLRDVPTSRWRTLLDRNRDAGPPSFHQSLRAKIDVTPRELVLSRALLLPDSTLNAFARDLADSFDIVLVKDSHREARLAGIADSLAEGDITFEDLETLLQVADIGVVNVSVEEKNIPERFLKLLRRLQHDLHQEEGDITGEAEAAEPPRELADEELELVVRHILLTHRGTAADCPPFSIREESDGTIAWLAIAVPALEALRRGGVLLVDESGDGKHTS